MKRLPWARSPTLPLACGAALAVVAYNAWSYCCGRCSLKTFFTLGPAGLILLGFGLSAALALLVLRSRNRERLARGRCGCGEACPDQWSFCPRCGTERNAGAGSRKTA